MKYEVIDHVWAGHPVGFALLTAREHQFVAYYDPQRQLTLAGRRLGGEWTRVKPHGVVTGWDSHNDLALALDRDGCLHFAGNMHNDPLVYWRTRRPFDLATLERLDRMSGDREQSVTYPLFFTNADGELLFRYRDGGSGRGSDIYNIYDAGTRAWRHLLDTPLLDGEGRRNAYALEPTLGPDGRFHLVWMWRDTPDCATNHTLSYARSRDLLRWETSRGQPIPLPITLAHGEVLDPARPGDGLINMTFSLGFDPQPLILYHRYDADGHSQVYAARPGQSPRQISHWDFRWTFSGLGSIAADVTLGRPQLAPDGTLIVDYWTRVTGPGRWRIGRRVESLPPAPPPVPREPTAPGMEAQTLLAGRWALRWETLPRNRDLPRETIPPPSELRLYELPAGSAASKEQRGR
jgi:hypothetical protein